MVAIISDSVSFVVFLVVVLLPARSSCFQYPTGLARSRCCIQTLRQQRGEAMGTARIGGILVTATHSLASSRRHDDARFGQIGPGSDTNNESRITLFERIDFLGAYLKALLRKLLNLWWEIKKFVRARIEKYTVYVLECEGGKYYVGSTANKKQRYEQHKGERGGSKWTRIHRPVQILEEHTRIPEKYYLGMESKITAEYMLNFGVNNVRGSMYAQTKKYTTDDLEALTAFLGHYNSLSYSDVREWLERTLPSAIPAKQEFAPLVSTKVKRQNWNGSKGKPKKCYKCGRFGHYAINCMANSDKCFACGQSGHFAADCPNI